MSEIVKNSSTCLLILMLAPALLADDSNSNPPEPAPTPLSVAPLDHVDYPDDRPEWLSRSVASDDQSLTVVVVSGPSETRDESLEELKLMKRAAVSTYISELTGSGGHFDFFPITDEEIEQDLVTRRYSGEVTQGDMKKYEDAVELRFSEGQNEAIRTAWKNLEVRDRLGALGVTVCSGLVMLICSSALIGLASRRVERREETEAVE